MPPLNQLPFLQFSVKLDALIPSLATPCVDIYPPCLSHREYDSAQTGKQMAPRTAHQRRICPVRKPV